MPTNSLPFSQKVGDSAFQNVKRVQLTRKQRERWQTQIDQVRHEFRRQNRRLGTPMRQNEVRSPAISRVVDQIRILLRLVDHELLKYDTEDQSVLPPESIRCLVQLNNKWADRLENQIWLLEDNLEHGRELNNLLTGLFRFGSTPFTAFDSFAHAFTDGVNQIPDASLLIPEPGLILADELAGHVDPGMSEIIAKALQTTRLVAWTQSHSRKLSKDRRRTILYALLRDGGLFAIDPRFRESRPIAELRKRSRQLASDVVSGWTGVPDGLQAMLANVAEAPGSGSLPNLVETVSHLVDLMEAQSMELARLNVLADIKTAFSPAVRQLAAEARDGKFDSGQVDELLSTLGLNVRANSKKIGLAERLLLFKRLRRHSAHQPSGADSDTESVVPRPKFLRHQNRRHRSADEAPNNSSNRQS